MSPQWLLHEFTSPNVFGAALASGDFQVTGSLLTANLGSFVVTPGAVYGISFSFEGMAQFNSVSGSFGANSSLHSWLRGTPGPLPAGGWTAGKGSSNAFEYLAIFGTLSTPVMPSESTGAGPTASQQAAARAASVAAKAAQQQLQRQQQRR